MRKKLLALLLALLLLVSFSACGSKDPGPTPGISASPQITQPAVSTTPQSETDSAKFKTITDALFEKTIRSDYLTLYVFLRDRQPYDDLPRTFGTLLQSEAEEYYTFLEDTKSSLLQIKYENLSDTEQVSYLTIKQDIAQELTEKDFYYYESPLNSITGIQSELPLVMSILELQNKQDVEDYLALMSSWGAFFDELIAFEQERAKQGLLANDENLQKVIDSCEEIAAEKNDHFLIGTFDERVDDITTLSSAEKAAYKAANLKTVQETVLPSYDKLAVELTKLKGQGTNNGGLCNFKNGKEYYALLLQDMSSSDMTVAEITSLLNTSINKKINNIISAMQADANIYNKMDTISLSKGDAQANLDYVKKLIATDYPAMPEHSATITDVPEALENSFSPAAYISSPLDDYKINHIVINQKSMENYADKACLMGHEAYPGHLYNNLFVMTSDMDNYRKISSYVGFSEGWAQMSEDYVATHMGFDDTLVQVYLDNNHVINELIPARIDIGVNYEGWSLEQTKEYVSETFGDYPDYAEALYNFSIEVPGYYIKYSIGYLTLSNLVDEVKASQGESFVYKDCMAQIMKIGNAPVNIVVDRVRAWAGISAQ